MCVYCMLADWVHKWVPSPKPSTFPVQPWTPWTPMPSPTPVTPPVEWNRPQYEELIDILAKIKDMEDRLGGCPCEDDSKMDFLREIKERLDLIEGKLNAHESRAEVPGDCCGTGCCEHEMRRGQTNEDSSHPITSG